MIAANIGCVLLVMADDQFVSGDRFGLLIPTTVEVRGVAGVAELNRQRQIYCMPCHLFKAVLEIEVNGEMLCIFHKSNTANTSPDRGCESRVNGVKQQVFPHAVATMLNSCGSPSKASSLEICKH